MNPVVVEGPVYRAATHCTPILRALPDWFGIETAIVNYSQEVDRLPTFLARGLDGIYGFLSLKIHNPSSAEIYVMGVYPQYHRQGIGEALVENARAWLRQEGYEYLQVKTLAPSHPDPSYAATRAFYLAQGFRPLEEFPLLWDENNPCLLMIQRI